MVLMLSIMALISMVFSAALSIFQRLRGACIYPALLGKKLTDVKNTALHFRQALLHHYDQHVEI
jgi:hypothetical protein